MSKKQIPLIMILLALLINAAARLFPNLAEYYVNHIFPILVETYGRMTGIFPFSIGEWMIYTAVCLLVVWLIWASVLSVRLCINIIRKRNEKLCKLKAFPCYSMILWWIVGIVSLVMTFHCFVLYQVPALGEQDRCFSQKATERTYGKEDLAVVRDMVVEQANRLSAEQQRNEKGEVVTELDLTQKAREEMARLGEMYPRLRGYYPCPKALAASEFFSQQYIMGYYFPFSMEANYNDLMYVVNKPATMCHELSHVKGFLLEDEANFIGYLACVNSEEPIFQYSGYLSVLDYLDRDFYAAVGETEYQNHPAISIQVKKDTVFLTEEAWEQVEEKAVLDTEWVQQSSYDFLETTLHLNGVEDGLESYSRVVELLLRYYDGKINEST